MSKIITTILLTIATIASALMIYTPAINVSAALNDPLRCSFPGRYIDATRADKPCDSCPVDFYCPTQIRNGSQFSPEKPGKNGTTNSEVIACPSGTTTLGFTYHPYKLSLLSKDEDGFKVGTLATDISMCKTPNFTCPTSTPRLVNVDGKSSCYSSCPANLVEVIKDGVQSCIIECRNDTTTVNGKCFEACASGQQLTITNGITNCNDKCANSVIRNQVVSSKGNCECPSGSKIVLDANSNNSGYCAVIETPKPVVSSSSAASSVVSSSSAQSSNNGGGFNWLGWLGVAAAGYLVYDGLSCGGLFNFGNCGSSTPATKTNDTVYQPYSTYDTTSCVPNIFESCDNNTYNQTTVSTVTCNSDQTYNPSSNTCICTNGLANNGYDWMGCATEIPSNATPRSRDFDDNSGTYNLSGSTNDSWNTTSNYNSWNIWGSDTSSYADNSWSGWNSNNSSDYDSSWSSNNSSDYDSSWSSNNSSDYDSSWSSNNSSNYDYSWSTSDYGTSSIFNY